MKSEEVSNSGLRDGTATPVDDFGHTLEACLWAEDRCYRADLATLNERLLVRLDALDALDATGFVDASVAVDTDLDSVRGIFGKISLTQLDAVRGRCTGLLRRLSLDPWFQGVSRQGLFGLEV